MITREGEWVRNASTGRLYRVKMIKNQWILLEEENGAIQALTGISGLEFFYRRVREEQRPEVRGACL